MSTGCVCSACRAFSLCSLTRFPQIASSVFPACGLQSGSGLTQKPFGSKRWVPLTATHSGTHDTSDWTSGNYTTVGWRRRSVGHLRFGRRTKNAQIWWVQLWSYIRISASRFQKDLIFPDTLNATEKGIRIKLKIMKQERRIAELWTFEVCMMKSMNRRWWQSREKTALLYFERLSHYCVFVTALKSTLNVKIKIIFLFLIKICWTFCSQYRSTNALCTTRLNMHVILYTVLVLGDLETWDMMESQVETHNLFIKLQQFLWLTHTHTLLSW